MPRYFIELAYKGTNFCGWQRQAKGASVQEEIEKALSVILRQPITITGAGRTDTGVHARYMVAHFDTESNLDEIPNLAERLSGILPFDIAIFSVTRVSDEAHSRFGAISRRYEYKIICRKDPFWNDMAAKVNFQPDVKAMNDAAAMLLTYEDFTSFCKLHGGNKTNICRVKKAEWKREGDLYTFTIEADRFLRNMVRAIVGTLLDVGRGKLTVNDFREIIEARDRGRASTSAPARGLYLVDVAYPPEVFQRKTEIIPY
jgi:tRNA pseudouridine38-40 synthase